ncbi:MAG: hypothetical protein J5517_01380 [Eubacterium sp.]|nr:hypothetical protein [Eubacterium sp.]
MKKFYVVVVMLAIMMGLAGCMRYNTEVEIKRNGKADLTITYAVNTSEDSLYDADDMKESMDRLKEAGWECQEYSEDGYAGYIIGKKDLEIDNLSGEMSGTEAGTFSENEEISIVKDGFNYTFDYNFLPDSEESEEDAAYYDEFEKSGGYMKFVLKVPSPAKNSNAHNVLDGGRTLEWDMLRVKPGEGMHAEFSIINWPLIIAALSLIFVIIVAAIIIIFVASNRNKKAMNASYEPYQPYGEAAEGGESAEGDAEAGEQSEGDAEAGNDVEDDTKTEEASDVDEEPQDEMAEPTDAVETVSKAVEETEEAAHDTVEEVAEAEEEVSEAAEEVADSITEAEEDISGE